MLNKRLGGLSAKRYLSKVSIQHLSLPVLFMVAVCFAEMFPADAQKGLFQPGLSMGGGMLQTNVKFPSGYIAKSGVLVPQAQLTLGTLSYHKASFKLRGTLSNYHLPTIIYIDPGKFYADILSLNTNTYLVESLLRFNIWRSFSIGLGLGVGLYDAKVNFATGSVGKRQAIFTTIDFGPEMNLYEIGLGQWAIPIVLSIAGNYPFLKPKNLGAIVGISNNGFLEYVDFMQPAMRAEISIGLRTRRMPANDILVEFSSSPAEQIIDAGYERDSVGGNVNDTITADNSIATASAESHEMIEDTQAIPVPHRPLDDTDTQAKYLHTSFKDGATQDSVPADEIQAVNNTPIPPVAAQDGMKRDSVADSSPVNGREPLLDTISIPTATVQRETVLSSGSTAPAKEFQKPHVKLVQPVDLCDEETEIAMDNIERKLALLEKGLETAVKESITADARFIASYPQCPPQDQFETSTEYELKRTAYEDEKRQKIERMRETSHGKILALAQSRVFLVQQLDTLSSISCSRIIAKPLVSLGRYDADKQFFPIAVGAKDGSLDFTFKGTLPIPRDSAKRFFQTGSGLTSWVVHFKRKRINAVFNGKTVRRYYLIDKMEALFDGTNYALVGDFQLPDYVVKSPEWLTLFGQPQKNEVAGNQDTSSLTGHSQDTVVPQDARFVMKDGQVKRAKLYAMENDTFTIAAFVKGKEQILRIKSSLVDSVFSGKNNAVIWADVAPTAAIDSSKVPGASATVVAYSAEAKGKEEEHSLSGQYIRKSITILPYVILADSAAQTTSQEEHSFIIERLEKEFYSLSRFDVNILPKSFYSEFGNSFRQTGEISDSAIASVFEKTVAPKIVKAIEASALLRAEGLLTEQQKNSWIHDKAKEAGVSSREFSLVLNCGYIALPMIREYNVELLKSKDTTRTWIGELGLGIKWYRILTPEQGKVSVVPVRSVWSDGFTSTPEVLQLQDTNLVVMSAGTPQFMAKIVGRLNRAASKMRRTPGVGETEPDPRRRVFHMVVNSLIPDMLLLSKEIPEFGLSSQVGDHTLNSVSFDIKKKEAGEVKIDDRFAYLVLSEDKDGGLRAVRKGWSIVSSKADSLSVEDSRIYGQTIAGSPLAGTIVKEIPKQPVDMILNFGISPASMKGTARLSNGIGLDSLDAGGICLAPSYRVAYDLRDIFKWRQTFATLGGSYVWGGVNSTAKLNAQPVASFSGLDLTLDFSKRFYFRRLAFRPYGGLGYSAYSIGTQQDSSLQESYSLGQAVFGVIGGSGIEFALTPSFNVGVVAGGRFGLPVGGWQFTTFDADGNAKSTADAVTETSGKIDAGYSGLQAGAMFTYCPTRSPWNVIVGGINSMKRLTKKLTGKLPQKGDR